MAFTEYFNQVYRLLTEFNETLATCDNTLTTYVSNFQNQALLIEKPNKNLLNQDFQIFINTYLKVINILLNKTISALTQGSSENLSIYQQTTVFVKPVNSILVDYSKELSVEKITQLYEIFNPIMQKLDSIRIKLDLIKDSIAIFDSNGNYVSRGEVEELPLSYNFNLDKLPVSIKNLIQETCDEKNLKINIYNVLDILIFDSYSALYIFINLMERLIDFEVLNFPYKTFN